MNRTSHRLIKTLHFLSLFLGFGMACGIAAELRIPAFTAYLDPDVNGAKISKEQGITGWHDAGLRVSWFGELKVSGRLTASVTLRLKKDSTSKLQLAIDRFMGVEDGRFFLSQGGFVPGYTKFGEAFTRPASSAIPKDIQLPSVP